MKFLPNLFENNRAWAEKIKLEDPQYFQRLSQTQTPEYLWIGCADSRVPANQICRPWTGRALRASQHRQSCAAVRRQRSLRVAVRGRGFEGQACHRLRSLRLRRGAGRAARRSGLPLENWLAHVRSVYRANKDELDAAPSEEARWRRLCELNVMAQVHAVREADIVREAWRKDQPVMVHGWIYDLKEGLLRDLDLN